MGEIWLKGPYIASGYWRDQDATRETFNAFMKDGKEPFLRTGDLGFKNTKRRKNYSGCVRQILDS